MAGAGLGETGQGGGWVDLVVLLPSGDAATVLLLCAEAAELSG